jgi:Fic family protein
MYYALLDGVRQNGDWESWLAFFLEGVSQTADGAVSTAQRLRELFQADHDRIAPIGRKAGSALRVHEALKARPLASINDVCERTGLSFPAAGSAMDVLGELNITRELTGKARNRIFSYEQYLAILSEGTEV